MCTSDITLNDAQGLGKTFSDLHTKEIQKTFVFIYLVLAKVGSGKVINSLKSILTDAVASCRILLGIYAELISNIV